MPEENTNKAQDNSTTHLGHICVIDTTYIGQGCENSRPLTDRHMAAEVLCKARFCQQSSAHTDRTVLLYTDVPILVNPSRCVLQAKHIRFYNLAQLIAVVLYCKSMVLLLILAI